MTIRQQMFFFAPKVFDESNKMYVRHQYCDEEIQEIIDTNKRYTYGQFGSSYIVKRQNILILTLPFIPGQWAQFKKLCDHIALCIQESYHPYKPILHLKLEDHSEWLI